MSSAAELWPNLVFREHAGLAAATDFLHIDCVFHSRCRGAMTRNSVTAQRRWETESNPALQEIVADTL